MEIGKLLDIDIGGMEAGKGLDRNIGGKFVLAGKEMICGKRYIESGNKLVNKFRVLITYKERVNTRLNLGLEREDNCCCGSCGCGS